MASIKDAIEECITDHLAAVKLLVLAVPLFLFYNSILSGAKDWSEFTENLSHIGTGDPLWGAISAVILLGLSVITTHNVSNSNNAVLPSMNIFAFIFQTAKALFALVPVAFLFSIIPTIIITSAMKFLPESATQMISFIVSAIFYFATVSSYILYAKDYKIKDAYKFKLIFETIVESSISVIFCTAMLTLVNALITGFIVYVFAVFKLIGSPLFIYVMSFIVVLNTAIFAHCLAQVGYEKLIKEENKDRII